MKTKINKNIKRILIGLASLYAVSGFSQSAFAESNLNSNSNRNYNIEERISSENKILQPFRNKSIDIDGDGYEDFKATLVETVKGYKIHLNNHDLNGTLFINKNYGGKNNNLDKLILNSRSNQFEFRFNNLSVNSTDRFGMENKVLFPYSKEQMEEPLSSSRKYRRRTRMVRNKDFKNIKLSNYLNKLTYSLKELHNIAAKNSEKRVGHENYQYVKTTFDDTKKLYGDFVKSLK